MNSYTDPPLHKLLDSITRRDTGTFVALVKVKQFKAWLNASGSQPLRMDFEFSADSHTPLGAGALIAAKIATSVFESVEQRGGDWSYLRRILSPDSRSRKVIL